MKLKPEIIQKVAHLAGIAVSPTEKKQLVHDIENILQYFKKLEAVDTRDVEPFYQTTGLYNVFRDDQVDALRFLDNESTFKKGALNSKGFVKAGKVFDRESETNNT